MLLEVKNLNKRFSGLLATSDVSFQIKKEEFIGLIGPNGAGKTTLFNLLTGFLPPTSGEIIFKGQSIKGLSPHQMVARGMARTFQLVKPFSKLSVLENVKVPALIARQEKRVSYKDIDSYCLETLEKVGLVHRAYQKSSSLSHGEQKRLEIARSLATNPELLLLDEPFCGLSRGEVDGLMELVRDLHQKHRLTVILVEHLLKVLMSLSQRVLVLDQGELIAQGTPEEIHRNPQVIEAYLGKGVGHNVVS